MLLDISRDRSYDTTHATRHIARHATNHTSSFLYIWWFCAKHFILFQIWQCLLLSTHTKCDRQLIHNMWFIGSGYYNNDNIDQLVHSLKEGILKCIGLVWTRQEKSGIWMNGPNSPVLIRTRVYRKEKMKAPTHRPQFGLDRVLSVPSVPYPH